MARRGFWLGSWLLAGGFVACVSNHEALEKKPSGHAGSSAGGVSSGGAPSHLGGFGGQAANGGGHADDEPPGESVLTIVNGVVDAPSVALCLAKVDADGNVIPLGSPLTDEPLEYGQSVVVREVEGVDFATEGLEPIVIAGKLELIAGLDCEAAIERARSEEALSDGSGGDLGAGGAAGDGSGPASTPVGNGGSAGESAGAAGEGDASAGASSGLPAVRSALRVRGLPAISARTLDAGRSLVFVANGCLGGATYSGKQAEKYCGSGYAARRPTASAILVSLSRNVSAAQVALQVVHASFANAEVELRSRPPLPSTSEGISIANVLLGEIAPRPASTQHTVFDLGSARKFQVSVEAEGTSLFRQSWSSVLAQGGLAELENGRGYALVLNGPQADLAAVPGLWNAPMVTAIAVDPE
jgi:hypothetical protein